LSKNSKKITERGKSWKKFEMESFQASGSPGKKGETPFVSLHEMGEEKKADFIPLDKNGEHHKKRKEAEDIIKEAQEKAALLEQDAYEKGFAQGEKDGFELGGKKATKAIENIENFLIELSHLKKEILRHYEKEILDLIFAIAKRITHQQMRADDRAVKDNVLNAIHLATEKSTITLRVNPEDYNYIEKLKQEFFAQFKELKSLDVTSDPSISRGGCFLETPYGDVDARVETQLEKIYKSLEDAFTENEDE
jgi:flagellar assembly protein FliH